MKIEQSITLTRAEWADTVRSAYFAGQRNGINVQEDRYKRDVDKDEYFAHTTAQVWG